MVPRDPRRRAGASPGPACVLSCALCGLALLAAVVPAAATGEAPANPRPLEGEFVTFARPDRLEETYEFNGTPMRKQTLFVLDGNGVFHITAVAPEGD
jgi:hypothetical protein